MADTARSYASGRRLVFPAARGGAAIASAAVTLAAGIGLVLLARPYLGLVGDSRIYIGRALADADPSGVGRDLMFANDGQSAFSLFPRLLDGLVQTLGPVRAGALTALCGALAWGGAVALMLRAFAGRATAPMLFASALIMPALYGGFLLLPGEAAAVPRPFAEAFVLLGLWALLERRLWLAAALMAAATTLHPIMAVAGWGVLTLDRIRADRRWLIAVLAGAAAVAGAAVLRLPLAERLLQPIDEAWLSVLRFRAPYLFVHLWPVGVFGRTATQFVTAGLACLFLPPRPRILLLSVLGTTALALAASLVLGDGLHSLLAVQLQPWRCLWLLAVFAAATFPVAVEGLWRTNALGRLAAGALAVGWASLAIPQVALPCVALSAGLAVLARRGTVPSRPMLVVGWILVATVGVLMAAAQTVWLLQLLLGPAAARPASHFLLLLDTDRVIAALVVLGALRLAAARPALMRWAPLGAIGLLGVGCATWDARDPSRRTLDDARAQAEVRSLLASRPGAIAWLGGDLEPAMLAGRASWQSDLQGASNVFSRMQALKWSRRGRRLVETGVAAPEMLGPFPHLIDRYAWTPTPSAIGRLCRDADAPAWIATPLWGDPSADLASTGAKVWTAPHPQPATRPDGESVLTDRTLLIPCHEVARSQAAALTAQR